MSESLSSVNSYQHTGVLISSLAFQKDNSLHEWSCWMIPTPHLFFCFISHSHEKKCLCVTPDYGYFIDCSSITDNFRHIMSLHDATRFLSTKELSTPDGSFGACGEQDSYYIDGHFSLAQVDARNAIGHQTSTFFGL